MADETKARVYQYFISKGYSPTGAAYQTGSFIQESGLNPNAWNPGEGAEGIAQWRGPRTKRLKDWADKQGLDPSELETQLEFSDHEAQGYPNYAALFSDNPEEAKKFVKKYEGYGVKGARDEYSAEVLAEQGDSHEIEVPWTEAMGDTVAETEVQSEETEIPWTEALETGLVQQEAPKEPFSPMTKEDVERFAQTGGQSKPITEEVMDYLSDVWNSNIPESLGVVATPFAARAAGPVASAIGKVGSKVAPGLLRALPLGAMAGGYLGSDEPDFKGKATDALLSWFLARTLRGSLGRRTGYGTGKKYGPRSTWHPK